MDMKQFQVEVDRQIARGHTYSRHGGPCALCGDLDGCHQPQRLDDLRQALRDAAVPRLVCLCGSTRFADEFMRAQFEETIAGRIVLTVGCFPRRPDGTWDRMQVTDEQKVALDALHFHKIELADEVYVINVGGYIGESTAREIAYARRIGRPVRYLERP